MWKTKRIETSQLSELIYWSARLKRPAINKQQTINQNNLSICKKLISINER